MKHLSVCIITGPCGGGKSTIAKALANEIKNSAYIDVDSLREMIKNGYASPIYYVGKSKKQVDLGTKNAVSLAINFLQEGFNVFIDDVLERKEQSVSYEEAFKNYRLTVFILLPNKKVLKKRDSEREKENVMGERALELHNILKQRAKEEKWHVLDTSNHTIKQTKSEITDILKKRLK